MTSQPQSFALSEIEKAFSHAARMVDEELGFSLFDHYLNECRSNLATLDTEYYDF